MPRTSHIVCGAGKVQSQQRKGNAMEREMGTKHSRGDDRGERRHLSELISLTEGVYDASERRRSKEDQPDRVRFRLVLTRRGRDAKLLPLEFNLRGKNYRRRTASPEDMFSVPIAWLGSCPSDAQVAKLPEVGQNCLDDMLGLIHEALFRVLRGERSR